MIEICAGIAICLCVLFYSFFVVQPQKRKAYYEKQLQKQGYKIYSLPFQILGFPHANMLAQLGQNGDAISFHKNKLVGYDILIGNIFHKIQLICVSKETINQLTTSENNFYLQKLPMLSKSLKVVFGRGLLLTDGVQWKQRRLYMNAMFTFDFVKGLGPKFAQIFDKVQLKIEQKYKDQINQNKLTIDALQITSLYASSTIMQVFLGGQCLNQTLNGESLPKFIIHTVDQTNRYSELPQSLILGKYAMQLSPFQSTKDLCNRVNMYQKWGIQFVKARITQEQQRMKNLDDTQKKPQNVIEAMVRSYNFTKNDNPYKNAKQIFQEFKTMFIGGSDSSAKYLLLMAYQFALCPEVQQKVRAEISQFMKDNDFSFENLKKLKYIDAVQKQITRMYGPINFLVPRQIIQDHKFCGINVYQGDTLEYFADAMHYSSKYYQEPYKFNPDRWLQTDSKKLPLNGFNQGQRSCIGKTLALLTNKVGIIKFLQKYKKIQIPVDKIPLKIEVVVGPHNFDSVLTLNSQ